jgi:hypothetical protein
MTGSLPAPIDPTVILLEHGLRQDITITAIIITDVIHDVIIDVIAHPQVYKEFIASSIV